VRNQKGNRNPVPVMFVVVVEAILGRLPRALVRPHTPDEIVVGFHVIGVTLP
jgi:hypothetical protein